MKRRFEFKDAKSNKFWEIELKKNSYTTTYGRIGTSTAQSDTNSFNDSETAQKEYEKIIRAKTKKGYVEVGANKPEPTESKSPDNSSENPLDAEWIQIFEKFFQEVADNNDQKLGYVEIEWSHTYACSLNAYAIEKTPKIVQGKNGKYIDGPDYDNSLVYRWDIKQAAKAKKIGDIKISDKNDFERILKSIESIPVLRTLNLESNLVIAQVDSDSDPVTFWDAIQVKSSGKSVTDKPKVTIDVSPSTQKSIEQLWDRFKSWFKKVAPDFNMRLGKPVSEKNLSKLATTIENLPNELIALLLIHDGSDGFVVGNWDFMKSEYIIREHKLMNSMQGRGDFGEGGSASPSKTITEDKWWNPGWIPFVSSGAGDFICIDMNPATEGTVGQIILFSHESEKRYVLAENLVDWFTQICTDLEKGKYVFDVKEESFDKSANGFFASSIEAKHLAK